MCGVLACHCQRPIPEKVLRLEVMVLGCQEWRRLLETQEVVERQMTKGFGKVVGTGDQQLWVRLLADELKIGGQMRRLAVLVES